MNVYELTPASIPAVSRLMCTIKQIGGIMTELKDN